MTGYTMATVLVLSSVSTATVAAQQPRESPQTEQRTRSSDTTKLLWRMSPTPSLDLGGALADSNQQFGSVVGAARLSDGSVAVADAKTLRITIFDATGQFLRRFGQRGEGPGDFRAVAQLFRTDSGDTLIVWDDVLGRLTSLAARGTIIATTPVDRPQRRAGPGGRYAIAPWRVLGMFRDGALLTSYANVTFSPPTEILHDTVTVSRIMRGNGAGWVLRLFSGDEFVFHTGRLQLSDDLPFGRSGSFAVGHDRWYYTDGSCCDIREYNEHGLPITTIRATVPITPVTTAVVDSFRHAYLDRMTGPQAQNRPDWKQALDWVTYPKVFPAYAGLRVDSRGEVWVERYGENAGTTRWDVFGADGTYRASSLVRAQCHVLEIGDEYVLCKVRDQDDVDHVEMFALSR